MELVQDLLVLRGHTPQDVLAGVASALQEQLVHAAEYRNPELIPHRKAAEGLARVVAEALCDPGNTENIERYLATGSKEMQESIAKVRSPSAAS